MQHSRPGAGQCILLVPGQSIPPVCFPTGVLATDDHGSGSMFHTLTRIRIGDNF